MKLLAACGFVFLAATGAFGQFGRSGLVVNGFGTNSGFGSVVFPAGRPSTGQPFTITNPAFPNVLGNVVAGRPAFSGVPGFQRSQRFNNRGFGGLGGGVVYVPYAYPVMTGGYGGYYGGEAPPQQPNVLVIYPPQQQTPVIINQQAPPAPQAQEYAPSSTGNYQVYQQPGSAEAAPTSESNYYLLAFTDHSIYSAVGYWVDGDTLHYITTGNVHNQISLALVDRDLTGQLNKGRGVDVKLPAPSK